MFDHIPVPNRKDLRLFGVVLAAILLALSLHAHWKHPGGGSWRHFLWYASPAVFLLAVAAPQSMFWVHRSMAYATAPIGWTVRNLVLFLVLLLVITPVRLFSREDRLRLKKSGGDETYWLKPESELPEKNSYAKLH